MEEHHPPALIGGLPSDYVPQNPTDTDFYYKDDEYRIFGNLPTEDLYKLQARLIQGGLLARGAFTPGDFDSATATAMRLVLGRQNRIGVKTGEKSTAWNEALLLYQNEPLPSGEEVLYIYHLIMQKQQQELETCLHKI